MEEARASSRAVAFRCGSGGDRRRRSPRRHRGAEGTDGLLARVAEMRRMGRLPRDGGGGAGQGAQGRAGHAHRPADHRPVDIRGAAAAASPASARDGLVRDDRGEGKGPSSSPTNSASSSRPHDGARRSQPRSGPPLPPVRGGAGSLRRQFAASFIAALRGRLAPRQVEVVGVGGPLLAAHGLSSRFSPRRHPAHGRDGRGEAPSHGLTRIGEAVAARVVAAKPDLLLTVDVPTLLAPRRKIR